VPDRSPPTEPFAPFVAVRTLNERAASTHLGVLTVPCRSAVTGRWFASRSSRTVVVVGTSAGAERHASGRVRRGSARAAVLAALALVSVVGAGAVAHADEPATETGAPPVPIDPEPSVAVGLPPVPSTTVAVGPPPVPSTTVAVGQPPAPPTSAPSTRANPPATTAPVPAVDPGSTTAAIAAAIAGAAYDRWISGR
jgi:hypothetical protein